MEGDIGAPENCGGVRADVELAAVMAEVRKVREDIDHLITTISVVRAQRLRQVTLARQG